MVSCLLPGPYLRVGGFIYDRVDQFPALEIWNGVTYNPGLDSERPCCMFDIHAELANVLGLSIVENLKKKKDDREMDVYGCWGYLRLSRSLCSGAFRAVSWLQILRLLWSYPEGVASA